eukprot:CAMPEP_0175825878 /NCGR_PEP_ID=MMETSP0107_2-20121207/11478_1 /TAXON_ID=195067 ORGANISM="Goniomonas pacifica, Strain CCMP1869" /NCGR_SAMPLE_ID=MMETSP0107_2 /ASSEMBLY_ACC=CAM_ASM_000203 /LENGTH=108 /DNA_ID=CAMNT_0017138503 /DNA_START=729 /DNA_END=1051 /DNA_ORIENTATION=+
MSGSSGPEDTSPSRGNTARTPLPTTSVNAPLKVFTLCEELGHGCVEMRVEMSKHQHACDDPKQVNVDTCFLCYANDLLACWALDTVDRLVRRATCNRAPGVPVALAGE